MVVWTQTSVVTPAKIMLRIPLLRKIKSRLVPTKLPLPGLSMTISFGKGANSTGEKKIGALGMRRDKNNVEIHQLSYLQ